MQKLKNKIPSPTLPLLISNTERKGLKKWLLKMAEKNNLPSEEKKKLIEGSEIIYQLSREHIAPLYILLAQRVLNKLKNSRQNLALILARDGLPIYLAAKRLKKQESEFNGIKEEQIRYLHYNGQFNPLVKGNCKGASFFTRYRRYLIQERVARAKKIIIVDNQCARGLSYRGLSQLLYQVNPSVKIEGEFIDLWPNGTINTYGLLQDLGGDPDFHLHVRRNRLILIEALFSGLYEAAEDILFDPLRKKYYPRRHLKQPPSIGGLSRFSFRLFNKVALYGVIKTTSFYQILIKINPQLIIKNYRVILDGPETPALNFLLNTIPWERRPGEWYTYHSYWTEKRKKEWQKKFPHGDEIIQLQQEHLKK